jgi:tetratricopeptide (TPR) repeat protein
MAKKPKKPVATAADKAAQLVKRALKLHGSGDGDGALKLLTEALELAPDMETYNDRGILHGERGETAPAIADFTKALELNPSHLLPLLNRGAARLRSGDRAGAAADLEEFLRREPDFEDAAYVRGMLEKAREAPPPEELPARLPAQLASELQDADRQRRGQAAFDLYLLAMSGRDIAPAEAALRVCVAGGEIGVVGNASSALAMHWLAAGNQAAVEPMLTKGEIEAQEEAPLGAASHIQAGAAAATLLHALRTKDRELLRALFLRVRPGIADLSLRHGIAAAAADATERGRDLMLVHSTLQSLLKEAAKDPVREASLLGIQQSLG